MLFEEATDINIFFGQATNEGNENSEYDIDFETKEQLINKLEENLNKMGKHVRITRC